MKLDLAVAEEVAKLKAKGYLVLVTHGMHYNPLVEDLGNDILIGKFGISRPIANDAVILTEGRSIMNFGQSDAQETENIIVFKRRALCVTTDSRTAPNGFIRSDTPSMYYQRMNYGVTQCWLLPSMSYFVRIHPYLPPYTKNVERASDTPKEKGRA